MPANELRPAVISMVKSIVRTTYFQTRGPSDRGGRIGKYLSGGWMFVSVVNSRHVVVRWEMRS